MARSRSANTTAETTRDESARRRRRPESPSPDTVGRRQVAVRKVDPWSVLKLSLIFYLCMLGVFMLALTVFWAVVNQLGVIVQLLSFLEQLRLNVTINGSNIARVVALIGLANVVLWSGINVFLAFLYNLIADIVGGLRLTVEDA